MHVPQAVRFDDRQLFVFALAEVGVDDNRAIVAAVDQLGTVPVLFHGPDDPIELPRRGRATRKKEVPRNVDLEGGVHVFGNDILVPGQVHQLVIVLEDRFGPGPQNGHDRLAHTRPLYCRIAGLQD